LPPRQIDWLALDDGHTVNRVEIEQHRERLFDSRALLTDGRRVYGVSNIDPDPNNSFLFWIE
jgi:hypothetical protein